MEKNKNFFTSLRENPVELYKTNKRKLCEIVTRGSFGFLYWINLLIPFYYGEVLGVRIHRNVTALKSWFLYFLVFFIPVIVYLVLAIIDKIKEANLTFKIHTILSIIMFLFMLLLYVGDTDGLAVSGLSIGFLFQLLIIVIMILLTWKNDLIMNFIYKIFKVPEAKIEEPVEASHPAPVPEPEVQPEPVPTPEPAPAPEPEPAPEPKDVEEVEEELEEIVEEETKIEETEQVIESLKEKE